MPLGTYTELVKHVHVNTVVLELVADIMLKLVFTLAVLKFSKKTITLIKETEKQGELVLP